MEQKAKRIGKLNIIDLIAIVLIVAVLALAAWKFIGKNGDSISYDRPQTKVTYQVKVEGVAPELYENCQAHLPSPLMASGALVGRVSGRHILHHVLDGLDMTIKHGKADVSEATNDHG